MQTKCQTINYKTGGKSEHHTEKIIFSSHSRLCIEIQQTILCFHSEQTAPISCLKSVFKLKGLTFQSINIVGLHIMAWCVCSVAIPGMSAIPHKRENWRNAFLAQRFHIHMLALASTFFWMAWGRWCDTVSYFRTHSSRTSAWTQGKLGHLVHSLHWPLVHRELSTGPGQSQGFPMERCHEGRGYLGESQRDLPGDCT